MFVYVETELLGPVTDSDKTLRRKRKSDLLCFVKLIQSEEQKFLGTVTLGSNSNVQMLLEAASYLLADKKIDKPMYKLSTTKEEFNEGNIPDMPVTNGTVLSIIGQELIQKCKDFVYSFLNRLALNLSYFYY